MANNDISNVICLFIGSLFIASLIWAKFNNKPFGKRSILNATLGVVFLGLPLWYSPAFSFSESKKLTANTSKQGLIPTKFDSTSGLTSKPIKQYKPGLPNNWSGPNSNSSVQFWADFFGVERETMDAWINKE